MLDLNDLTKEQIEQMSDEELLFWTEALNKHLLAEKAKKYLLDYVETQTVEVENIIKLKQMN